MLHLIILKIAQHQCKTVCQLCTTFTTFSNSLFYNYYRAWLEHIEVLRYDAEDREFKSRRTSPKPESYVNPAMKWYLFRISIGVGRFGILEGGGWAGFRISGRAKRGGGGGKLFAGCKLIEERPHPPLQPVPNNYIFHIKN